MVDSSDQYFTGTVYDDIVVGSTSRLHLGVLKTPETSPIATITSNGLQVHQDIVFGGNIVSSNGHPVLLQTADRPILSNVGSLYVDGEARVAGDLHVTGSIDISVTGAQSNIESMSIDGPLAISGPLAVFSNITILVPGDIGTADRPTLSNVNDVFIVNDVTLGGTLRLGSEGLRWGTPALASNDPDFEPHLLFLGSNGAGGSNDAFPSLGNLANISLSGDATLGGTLRLGSEGLRWGTPSLASNDPEFEPHLLFLGSNGAGGSNDAFPSLGNLATLTMVEGGVIRVGSDEWGAGGLSWMMSDGTGSNAPVLSVGTSNNGSNELFPSISNIERVVARSGLFVTGSSDAVPLTMGVTSIASSFRDVVYRGSNTILASFSNHEVDLDAYYGLSNSTLSNMGLIAPQLFVSHVDSSNKPRRVSGYVVDTGDNTTRIALHCEVSASNDTEISWMLWVGVAV